MRHWRTTWPVTAATRWAGGHRLIADSDRAAACHAGGAAAAGTHVGDRSELPIEPCRSQCRPCPVVCGDVALAAIQGTEVNAGERYSDAVDATD